MCVYSFVRSHQTWNRCIWLFSNFTLRNLIFKIMIRSSCCGSAVTNPASIMRMRVRSLASISGLRIRHCHELHCRSKALLRPGYQALLWLWHRPAAAAQIRPLAWGPPCAAGTALKRKKEKRILPKFKALIKLSSSTSLLLWALQDSSRKALLL